MENDMQPNPTVSVIVPTCNRPELLRVALNSLTWQAFKDFEVIVVNDGEADVTPVAAEFAGSLDLVLLESPVKGSGPSAVRNTGIRAARGTYLCYLDDDDFYYEHNIKVLYNAIRRFGLRVAYGEEILALQKLVGGKTVTVARYINHEAGNFSLARLAGENFLPTRALMHKADCLKRSGLFAEYLRGHEDWDLWQRMARHYTFMPVKTPIAEYLFHHEDGQLSEHVLTMAKTWLFVRRQGQIFHSMPPVYTLEKNASSARWLGTPASGGRVQIILCAGEAGAFLRNQAALQSLERLCGKEMSGQARLLVAGWGDAMPLLYRRISQKKPHTASCLWFSEDPGRVFASNKAAENADAEWLLFLEPFVAPAGSEWLDAMLACAGSRPDIGAVGGVLAVGDRPALAGGKLSARDELVFDRDVPKPGDVPREAYCLTGLCLMVRRDHFLAVGGFDPSFAPWHYADADLCLRLREQGLISVIAPEAVLSWNHQKSRLSQTPSGLAGRRAFWDRWIRKPFALEQYIKATDWSLRPEDGLPFWPSEGTMPHSFDVALPLQYQAVLERAGLAPQRRESSCES